MNPDEFARLTTRLGVRPRPHARGGLDTLSDLTVRLGSALSERRATAPGPRAERTRALTELMTRVASSRQEGRGRP